MNRQKFLGICSGFNDCKFVIAPSMKFGIAKLPNTFCKTTKKKLKRKKNNNKELSSIEDRKVNTNLCYDGRKRFRLLFGKFVILKIKIKPIRINAVAGVYAMFMTELPYSINLSTDD